MKLKAIQPVAGLWDWWLDYESANIYLTNPFTIYNYATSPRQSESTGSSGYSASGFGSSAGSAFGKYSAIGFFVLIGGLLIFRKLEKSI